MTLAEKLSTYDEKYWDFSRTTGRCPAAARDLEYNERVHYYLFNSDIIESWSPKRNVS